jgi:hypothetical protein
MKEFGEIVKSHGFIISKIKGAEGDDLMFLWSKKLLENKENSIILTGDKDMNQLVKHTDDNYIIIYNPNSTQKKITANIGFNDWLGEDDVEVDVFNLGDVYSKKESINKLLNKNIPLEEVDSNRYIRTKVLTGDSGDNVPSIFTWKAKSGKRTNRITEARANKILDFVENKIGQKITIQDFVNFSDEISEGIKHVCKQKTDPIQIKERLDRNIQLVYLNEKVLPDDLTEKFNTHFNNSIKLPKLRNTSFKKDTLIKGTRFEPKEEGFSIKSGIFTDINNNSLF